MHFERSLEIIKQLSTLLIPHARRLYVSERGDLLGKLGFIVLWDVDVELSKLLHLSVSNHSDLLSLILDTCLCLSTLLLVIGSILVSNFFILLDLGIEGNCMLSDLNSLLSIESSLHLLCLLLCLHSLKCKVSLELGLLSDLICLILELSSS